MKSTRDRLLASTIICGVAIFAAAPAFAQDAPVQEVVVTGSRIPQPNLTSTSPLTVINNAEIKFQGATGVESLLNNLPQVVADQSSQVSNGSDGTATVNLRNLGAKRTLVLVDGKRLNPGDPNNAGVADLNDIPSALVDRVDVVTGGASSVYGSDAVAGVVNFIMKKNFQGLSLDAQGGFFNHQQDNDQVDHALATAPYYTGAVKKPGDVTADGFTYEVTATMGMNSTDGKGNVTAYAGYRHSDPVLQSARDFSACIIGTDTNTFTNHYCAGSSNSAYGRFDNTGAVNPVTGRGTTSRLLNPDGSKTLIPLNSQAAAYNTDPLNYLQREDTRYQAGYFAHYDISPKLEVYSDFMFTDDDTNGQIAPSGFFSGTGPNLATGYTFNCNNPLISAAEAGALCPGAVITPGAAGGATTTQSIRYRFATVPRNTDFRHTDYKIDIGARGDLGQGWHYDAYLQYGTSVVSDLTTGYASETHLQNALNVVTDPTTGLARCVTSDSKCVPLDIFSSLGRNFSQAALNYVLAPGVETGQTVEQVASASINGDLGQYGIKSPFADTGVGVAFGTEYRRESITLNNDEELLSGDLSGTGGPAGNSQGAFDVYELFGEARIPLVNDKFLVKDLDVDFGYRFSDYSGAGKTDTYKAELNYAPISDVRLRFSYNRAVRAPSAIELFAANLPGLGGFQDPCSGAHPQFTQAQCTATGLNPALYGVINPCASAQCSILTGGNPNLAPEIADTFSIGMVFTPRFIKGFTASVDYFNINVENVIDAGAGPTSILANCAAGETSYCDEIHRDAQGTINSAQGYVLQTNQNSGSLMTRGVDITANYRARFSDYGIPLVSQIPGSFAISAVATYTENLTFQPLPGEGHYDCAGLFGNVCGDPQAHWKGQVRTTWITPWAVQLSFAWRYIGGVKYDGNTDSPFLSNGFYDAADAKIGDYNYFDFSGNFKLRDRYTIRFGINNLFDKDPPIIDQNNLGIVSPSNFGNGNTFPGTYDSLGRTVFIGMTADF